MKLRYVQFVTLLLWGYQAELLWFALPMGLIWEGQFLLNRRWELTKQDFYRVADLTSIALIFLIVFLFLNRADYHFISTLIQWLPILFFPLVVILDYSTTSKMSLDVLFYSLRRQQQPVTQSWDMDYFLFGICLIAAGMNTDIGTFYFPIVSLLVCLSLWPLRSDRYPFNQWVLVICIIFLSAFMTQQFIRGSHLELKRRTATWIANWVQQRTNPLKTQTSIGAIGKLKLSDQILFRIEVPAGKAAPELLQEASYNLPTGSNGWTIMDPTFSPIKHADDFRWQVNDPDEADIPVTIYLEFGRKQSLVPLPQGTTEISDLPALDIKKTYYGAVQGIGLVRSPKYRVKFHPGKNLNGNPEPTDTFIPPQYQSLIQQAIGNKPLDSTNPELALRNYFKDFRYSLYQDIEGADKAFANFLLKSHAGHCEYFASASVLLLRQMGIPARYVVGYSVQEYSDLIDMYVVRRRHGHAWAIAYLDNRWQVIDNTPNIWLATESEQSSLIQPLIDLVTNSNFMFQNWWNDQKIEDYEIHLYIIGAILTLILLWRIMTSEQVILHKEEAGIELKSLPTFGAESPFYQLEQLLQEQGYTRGHGELLEPWLTRIGYQNLVSLLPVHNQWRFDPKGISEQQRQQLAADVAAELLQLHATFNAEALS